MYVVYMYMSKVTKISMWIICLLFNEVCIKCKVNQIKKIQPDWHIIVYEIAYRFEKDKLCFVYKYKKPLNKTG